MTLFKKTFLIALTAQVAYWLIAALVFGKGQLIFHAAAALVGATFLAIQLAKEGGYKWQSVILWPVLVVVCYKAVNYWARFINWTLDHTPFLPIWNVVRFLDMVLMSVLIAYGVVLGQKWFHSKKHS